MFQCCTVLDMVFSLRMTGANTRRQDWLAGCGRTRRRCSGGAAQAHYSRRVAIMVDQGDA